jgi:DNA-binding transcriptional ArsR family regulator
MNATRKPGVDVLFSALADPVRRRAIEILGERPRRAGELADLLDIPAPAMSRHLKTLKASELVIESHPEIDARVRVYALNGHRLAELKDWLERAEQLWSGQLVAFARHVEKRKQK